MATGPKILEFKVIALGPADNGDLSKGTIELEWDISGNLSADHKVSILVNPNVKNTDVHTDDKRKLKHQQHQINDTSLRNHKLTLDQYYTDVNGDKKRIDYHLKLLIKDDNGGGIFEHKYATSQDGSGNFHRAHNLVYAPDITLNEVNGGVEVKFHDEVSDDLSNLKDLSGNFRGGMHSNSILSSIDFYINEVNNTTTNLVKILPEKISDISNNKHILSSTHGVENEKEYEISVVYNITASDGKIAFVGLSPVTQPKYVKPTFTPKNPRGLSLMRPVDDSLKQNSAVQLFWQAPDNDVPGDDSEDTVITYYEIQYAVRKTSPQLDSDWTDLSGSSVISGTQISFGNEKGDTHEDLTGAKTVNALKAYDTSIPRYQGAVYSVVLSGFDENRTVWARVRAVRNGDSNTTGDWSDKKKAVIYNYTNLVAPTLSAHTTIDVSDVEYSLDLSGTSMTQFTDANVDISELLSGDLSGNVSVDISNNGINVNVPYNLVIDIDNDKLKMKYEELYSDSDFNKTTKFGPTQLKLQQKSVTLSSYNDASRNDLRVSKSTDLENIKLVTGGQSQDATPYKTIPEVTQITTTALNDSGETLSTGVSGGKLKLTFNSQAILDAYSGSKFLNNNMSFSVSASQQGVPSLPQTAPNFDNSNNEIILTGLSVNKQTTVTIKTSFTNSEKTSLSQGGEVQQNVKVESQGASNADNADNMGTSVPFYEEFTVTSFTITPDTDASGLNIAGEMTLSWDDADASDTTGIVASDEVKKAYKIDIVKGDTLLTPSLYSTGSSRLFKGLTNTAYKATVSTGYVSSKDLSANEGNYKSQLIPEEILINVPKTVRIFIDDKGSYLNEISWEVLNSGGTVEMSGDAKDNKDVSKVLPGGDYTLKCMDNYGDGWNGNDYQIFINDTLIETGTVEDGDQKIVPFTVQLDLQLVNAKVAYTVIPPVVSIQVTPGDKQLTVEMKNDTLGQEVILAKVIHKLDNTTQSETQEASKIYTGLTNGQSYQVSVQGEYRHALDTPETVYKSNVASYQSNPANDASLNSIPFTKSELIGFNTATQKLFVKNNGRRLTELSTIGITATQILVFDSDSSANYIGNNGGGNDAELYTIPISFPGEELESQLQALVVVLENAAGITIGAGPDNISIANADVDN